MVLSAVGSMVFSTASSAQQAPSGGVRLDSSRFTIVANASDARLARSLMDAAISRDTFPGLPRPRAHVLIGIAPDMARFRAWTGPHAPEWGAAIAFPAANRIVMQGARAGSDAGDPLVVLRHELAHLALHEYMGDLPPRWFDEGYASVAAGEWTREQAFETSLGLVWRSMPRLDSLDAGFYGSASQAGWSYALAHRAVAELSGLDRVNGLTNFFRNWKEAGAFDRAVRLSFGITLDAFDRQWHAATRRRYGALALVSNVSLAVGFFALVLGPLFIARRRRDRQRLEAMRAFEAAQEKAARESALQALLSLGEDGVPRVSEP